MNDYIKSIFEAKVQNTSPESNTDLANSLDLLSSGIYTEEERFVYELLQNAVDAMPMEDKGKLKIRIEAKDDFIVFMHNGVPFSMRDVEGICSVGNGNKSTDMRKIGYKGIGFKSVFMHSKEVYIKTEETIFRFDKQYWKGHFGGKNRSESGRVYEMPWQIIPILTEKAPVEVDTEGFHVCTYIRSGNVDSLVDKVYRLLNNREILLFLRCKNIEIDLYQNGERCRTLSKVSEETEVLGEDEEQVQVLLSVDGDTASKWLVYKNDQVALSDREIALIRSDSKTPQKLMDSSSFDLSFAVQMTDEGQIEPVAHSVLYTYLPTSFQFGFPFLANANFITDAGRQHLNDDAEWNKAVVRNIPFLYLKWMGRLSQSGLGYYRVLPPLSISGKVLGEVYNSAIKEAVETIPFVLNQKGDKLLLAKEAVADKVGLADVFSEEHLDGLLQALHDIDHIADRLVDPCVADDLGPYGITILDKKDFFCLLEKGSTYFSEFDLEDIIRLVRWMASHAADITEGNEQFISQCAFLWDEDEEMAAPNTLFFPSVYRDSVEEAKDAKFIADALWKEMEDLKSWLKALGVSEMDNYTLIRKVFCKSGYITKENTVEVICFIFEKDQNGEILDNLYPSELNNLKLLSNAGNLCNSTSLYLSSDYQTNLAFDFECDRDVFVSSAYLREGDDRLKWALFFKRLGVMDEVALTKIHFDKQSDVFKSLHVYTKYAEQHEYNHSNYTGGDYYMSPSEICAKFSSLIRIGAIEYEMKQFAWNILLSKECNISHDDDYIYGSTGYNYVKRAFLADNIPGHQYLGESFMSWVLREYPLLPSSTGGLARDYDLLENTPHNRDLCGKYFPVLAIDNPIHDSWRKHLTFRKDLTIDQCLSVLSNICNDYEALNDNLDRISWLYDKLCNYDIQEGDAKWKLLSDWGKTHKILSKDKQFRRPCELVLVSALLGNIDLDNQVFVGKHVEYKSNQLVNLMRALGVKFISNFSVQCEKIEENVQFKEKIRDKAVFIALVAAGRDADASAYQSKYEKVKEEAPNLIFENDEWIKLTYGDAEVGKKVYVDGYVFHYVGALSMVVIDLILPDLAKILGVPAAGRSALATLMQITSRQEMTDYLQEKGYDISLIPQEWLVEVAEEGEPGGVMGVQEGELSGPSSEVMQAALIEAKDVILYTLSNRGYDVSGARWDGWTRIDGVKKEGEEYPLVIRSNKTGISTRINASDWLQLMKPNSMLVVNTADGPGTLSLRDMLRSKEEITIKFHSNNLDKSHHITEIAQVLQYFNGLQMDWGSFIPVSVNQWERFAAPENNTGELPVATRIELPE